MGATPSDFIQFLPLLSDSQSILPLYVVNDTEEVSSSLYSIIEREVYPRFLSRLRDNTNAWVLKKAAGFQRIDPLFQPLPYTNSFVEFNTLFFPTEASRYAYFIGVMRGSLQKDCWYRVQFFTNSVNTMLNTSGQLAGKHALFGFNASYNLESMTDKNSVVLDMYPLEVINVNKYCEVVSPNEINIVLFVDWRYFIRDSYYRRGDAQTGISTASENIIVNDINTIVRNLTEVLGEWDSSDNVPNSVMPHRSALLATNQTQLNTYDSELFSRNIPFKLRSLEGCPLPLAIDTILAFYGMRLYGHIIPFQVPFSTEVNIKYPALSTFYQNFPYPSAQVESDMGLTVYFPVSTAGEQALQLDPNNYETNLIPSEVTTYLENRVKKFLNYATEIRLCLNSIPDVPSSQATYGLFYDFYNKDSLSSRGINGYHFHSSLNCLGYTGRTEHIYLNFKHDEISQNCWEYQGSFVEKRKEESWCGCPECWSLTQLLSLALNTTEINNGSVGSMGNGAFVGGKRGTGLDVKTVADSTSSSSSSNGHIVYDRDKLLPVVAGGIYKVTRKGNRDYFTAENSMENRAGIRKGILAQTYDGTGNPIVTVNGISYQLEQFSPGRTLQSGTEILFERDVDTQTLRAVAGLSSGAYENGRYISITTETEGQGENQRQYEAINWDGFSVYENSTETEHVVHLESDSFITYTAANYGEQRSDGVQYKSVTISWEGFQFQGGYVSGGGNPTTSFATTINCGTGLSGSVNNKVLTLSWSGMQVEDTTNQYSGITKISLDEYNTFSVNASDAEIQWNGFKYVEGLSASDNSSFARKICCSGGIQGVVIDDILYLSISDSEDPFPPYDPNEPYGPGGPGGGPGGSGEPEEPGGEGGGYPPGGSGEGTEGGGSGGGNASGMYIWFDNVKRKNR